MKPYIVLALAVLLIAPHGAWGTTVYFVDSQGYVEQYDSTNPGKHALPAGPWEAYPKAGGIAFSVSFADVSTHNGYGFDDAAQGAARRARVQEIFTYLNQVLNHSGKCTVVFDQSTSGQPWLAVGGTNFTQSSGFTNGIAFQDITTGSTDAPNLSDIEITVDFSWPWYAGTGAPDYSQVDLKSVLLHEITHGLGIITLAGSSGASDLAPHLYGYWDSLLYTGNGKHLFGGAVPNFLGTASDLTGHDNGVYYGGTRAVAAYGGQRPPVYAPNPWEEGSSLAHWADSATGSPVMSHAIGEGVVIRAYAPYEIGALADIGYTVVTGGPKYTLTIVVSPTGAGTVNVSPTGGQYDAGTTVGLTAVAGDGYVFDHWQGSVNSTTSETTSVVVTADLTVTAFFKSTFNWLELPSGGWFELGQSLNLEVRVSGVGEITYQWNHDGTDISDATNNVYHVDSITRDDAGQYVCRVTDQTPSTHISPVATVAVFPAGSLPVGGAAVLPCLIVALTGAGIWRARRRTHP